MARIHWKKDKSIIFLVVYETKWSGVINVMHKTLCFCPHSIITRAVSCFITSNEEGMVRANVTTFWLKFVVKWGRYLVASHLCFTFFFLYLGGLCTLVQNIPVWKCRNQILPLKALRVVSCWELEVFLATSLEVVARSCCLKL